QRVIQKAIAEIPMGNIRLNSGGDAQSQREEFPHLIGSFVLSIIFVYLLMAVLFNSLLHPLTIQFSLPMALTGAIAALVIAHQTLSIISMIGFIMLVGDRKSTRLNSSHVSISYAVFCLKKKKNNIKCDTT